MIDIFEELDKKFNIIDKTNNLSDYLERKNYYWDGYYYTFFELFENSFHYWDLNDNYPSLVSMLKDLEIISAMGNDYDHYSFNEHSSMLTFFFIDEIHCYKFLQLIKNALEFLKVKYKHCGFENQFIIVDNKVKQIVSKVNLDFIFDNEKGYFKLVENKPLVREVAEKTNNKEIAYRLYEYNLIDNKTNLEKKKEILLYLATYTEHITKNYKKKAGDIYELYDNLDFALNNLHIRHDNKKPQKNSYVSKLTDAELIELYDKVYDLFLQVLTIENTAKSLDDIKSLKKQFDTKQLS